MQDIVGAAVGAASVVQDAQEFFVKPFAGLVVAEEAARAGKCQVVGDDVEGAAAVERTDGYGEPAQGRHDAHAQGLQVAVKSVEAVDRALGQIRTGAVAAVAIDPDFEAEAAGHGRFAADGDFSRWNIPAHVGGIAGIDVPAAFFFYIVKEIGQGARFFFTLLEHEDDFAVPAVLPLVQQFGGDELHGDVTVVAAGVHDAGGMGPAAALLRQVAVAFLDRQGVDIGAQEQGLPRILAVYPAEDAAVLYMAAGDAVFGKLFLNIGHRLRFLTGQLGMFVAAAADGCQFSRFLLYCL